MAQNSTPISNNNGIQVIDPPLLRTIKFSLFVVGVPISMTCYLFIIYQLLSHRSLREGLHNHAVIVNLCFNLVVVMVDLPFILNYLHLAYVIPATEAHCLVWQFVDYGIWFTDVFVTFWASIERHILIFHSNMINTAKKRLFVHWMPLAFFSLYAPTIYAYLVFFYPTPRNYDYTQYLCGGPYYYNDIAPWLLWYETIVHYIMPNILIVVLGFALVIRVVLQKQKLCQSAGWRQYRRMTKQFVFISLVYIFNLPYIIVTIVRWSGYPDFGLNVQGPYFFYMLYIPTLFFPFAVLATMPNLREKFGRYFHQRTILQMNTIVPTNHDAR
ncbi:unnamed protein product [Rotaria magnacalcarata]|uniref:G-protein coupled receptors family 1 profile domain-containing protein n=1 Tax=Rotaria magnacalcarata TaxID=392030 RepID=A0A816L9P0_9BILA|nr:unnamed protein product [Rotaria magnacalcarata]CAF1452696.1 unnamed protein product [Rotaria magnacalcarata]CAF1931156.1 unnamed protein product [Rotaria magnacalcarata]CAF2069632.1 unnamed protein product [Rotaria magnacalcarata]CAF2171097.1 unnamed protein product [Rotaria magnacalcarata]